MKNRKGTAKRALSLFLTAAMILSAVPASPLAVYAENTGSGLCAHHAEHTAECGYLAAREEVPCDRDCTDKDGDGVIDHAEDCAYTPAAEGQLCTYVCNICPVQELMDALPEAGDITADNVEELTAQLSAIDEALAALTEEERGQADTGRYTDAVNALAALEKEAESKEKEPEETQPVELTIEGETEGYVPDADALPDNDELFAGYAMRTLYGESGIATLGDYGPTVLESTEQAIYRELKTAIQAIAAGTSSSTVLTTTTEFNLKWETDKSGEELKAEAAEKLKEAIDTDKIVDCLLADCPYEMYWFDKTNGVETGYSIQTSKVLHNDGTTITTANIENLTLSFSVASAYAGTDAYTTDTSKTRAASAAVANAQAVITDNADKSDYEKLVAYKEYICDAVSYNHDAVNDNADYGDPWQIIYVFDGKEDTNVVCEGYSKAFQYLCDLSGLTCYTVTGTMSGGTGAHMWNIVTLDGKNYLVDVTNSDDNTVGAYGGLFLAGAPNGSATGYTITIPSHDLGDGSYTVESTITFTYDEDTTALYSIDILTIAATDYTVVDCTDHVYGEWETTYSTHTRACVRCGAKSEPTEHTYNEDGTACNVCGHTKTDVNVLDITLDPIGNFTYNGQEQSITVNVTGAELNGEAVELTYTVSGVTSATNAGEYTYTLVGTGHFTGEKSSTWKIQKKERPDVEEQSRVYWKGDIQDGTVSIDLSEMDPLLPTDRGMTDYDIVSQQGCVSGDAATIQNGKVIFPINLYTDSGDKGTLILTADMQNYEETYIIINITLVDAFPVTITGVTAQNGVYNGQPHPGYTGSPASTDYGYDGDFTVTYSGRDGTVYDSTDAPTDAGKYTVTFAVPTDNLRYTGSASLDFEIAKSDLATAVVTLALPDDGYIYDGTEKTPGVTVVKNGNTLMENTDYTVAYAENTNAGTATVTVTAMEDGNYYGSQTVKFEIARKTLTDEMLTLTQDSFTYMGAEIAPEIAVTDGTKALTHGTDYTVSENSENAKTDVGKYCITVQGEGNYTGAATAAWEITKADMTTVTAQNVSVTYDKTGHGIIITGAPAGAQLTYSTDGEIWSADNPSFTDAGSYTVYYRVQHHNYHDFNGSASVTIVRRPVTVSGITVEDKAYDGTANAALNYAGAAFDAIVEGDSLSVTAVGAFANENAGENKIVSLTGLTLGGASAGNYVLAANGQQTETTAAILPKDITVNITPGGGVYAGTITAATADPVGVVDGDTVNVTLTYTGTANDGTTTYQATDVPTEAGSYTVTATIGNGNYRLTGTVTADFVVARADTAFSVSPDKADKTYGDEAFVLTPSHVGDGEVTYESGNTEVATVDADGTVTLHNAGTAMITVTLTQTANYEGAKLTVTIHVEKMGDTLTVGDLEYEVIYGAGEIVLLPTTASGNTVVYTSSNPDVAAVDTDGTVHIAGAGEAVITLETGGSKNYKPVSETVKVIVLPKEITVTADDLTKIYGEDDPKLTYKASGLVADDVLEKINLTHAGNGGVGTYEILASQAEGANPNYSIRFVNGTLTVLQKDITGADVELGAALIENGKTQTQKIQRVTVQNSKGETIDVTYEVTGNTGKDWGTYTMTITGTGNFAGTVTKTFVIAPAADSAVEPTTDGTVKIGDGSIGIEVQHETGAPAVTLQTGKTEIFEMLTTDGHLSAEDLSQVAAGADIDIILKVTDASGTISAESKAQIEKAARGYIIGRYLDISLYKQITVDGRTGELVPITGVTGGITVSVEIPKELLNTDEAVTRTFWILRNHEGVADFLPATYDAKANTLTFTTDRFSEYAIVYQDTRRTTEDDSRTPEKDDSDDSVPLNTATGAKPETGDNTKPWLWISLLLISCGGMVAVIFRAKRKKDRTE